jgi:hypothetical protein
MKIEIEDEQILNFLINKLMKSPAWQQRFNAILREQIKIYGNEYQRSLDIAYMISYLLILIPVKTYLIN